MGIYYNYCIITPLYMDTPYGLAEILDEHAYPSYYCATLGSSGIQCEATVWNQVAHHRYHLEQCKSVKHRLHPKRSEEVKGRVEICEANTTRP